MAIDNKKLTESSTNRRNPSQTRSRERVETLLLSVKALIEEKGIAQLKISDIAKHSGFSPSSIYQYFSDKETMIIALARQYMEVIHQIIETNLVEMNSLQQLPELLKKNFLEIYQLHCQEAALREIWFESIDPKLNRLAYEDTGRNIEMITDKLCLLAGEAKRDEYHRFVMVCSHQFSAIMRLCVNVDDAEARRLIDIQTRMVLNSLPEFLPVEN